MKIGIWCAKRSLVNSRYPHLQYIYTLSALSLFHDNDYVPTSKRSSMSVVGTSNVTYKIHYQFKLFPLFRVFDNFGHCKCSKNITITLKTDNCGMIKKKSWQMSIMTFFSFLVAYQVISTPQRSNEIWLYKNKRLCEFFQLYWRFYQNVCG